MKKKVIQGIVKISVFVIIANLPFLTITHLLGIETFIDSFKHPNSYQYIKNDKINLIDAKGEYVILEKPTSQGYSIGERDTVLYHTIKDTLQQSVVYEIVIDRGIKTYYTAFNNEDDVNGPIYDQQIIGKIKGTFDDNTWNTLCLQIWILSIDNLNTVAFFSND